MFESHKYLKYFHSRLFEIHAARDYIMKE